MKNSTLRLSASVLLAGFFCMNFCALQAQIVKTWSYSTSSSKTKVDGGKSSSVGGVDCTVEIDRQISIINELFALKSDVGALVQESRVTYDRLGIMKEQLNKIDGYLPETPDYIGKLKIMSDVSGKCRSKGQKNLTDETIAKMNDHGTAMQSALEKGFLELGKLNDKVLKYAGVKPEDDIFVSSGPDIYADPAKAEKLLKEGKDALAMFGNVMERYPAQKIAVAPKMEETKGEFVSSQAKIDEARAQIYQSDYHKAHPGTLAVCSGAASPGQEASVLKSEWKPGEDFSLLLMLKDYMSKYTPNNTFRMEFFIGERSVDLIEFQILEFDKKHRNSSYINAFVFNAKPEDNIESSCVRDEDLQGFFKTFAMLKPARHEVRIVVSPRDGNKIAEGKVIMDLTGQPTGVDNWFSKAAKAIDDYKEAAKRENMFGGFVFENKLKDATLKLKVEAALVKMGEGKIKAAKVFFDDDRWTAYVNDMNTPLYRSIFFTFILETSTGEFYVGDDLVSQDGLLGGGFDTNQNTPVYGPFDTYTGEFKDLWDHNNRGRGMYMLKVPKEKIAAYWK